jgi:hypothetical protein
MKLNILIMMSLLMSKNANSIIGQDTALLVELVTTTASQLNELEKLVSNTEKYTARMQKYNELVQDEYFRAQRVLYLAESVASKKEAQSLGSLNHAIRELKYNLNDLQELMGEYAKIRHEEKVIHQEAAGQKKVNAHKEKIAKNQVDQSARAQTSARASQLAAQNTALIYENNVEMHNTQLQILEKLATQNRLMAEQLEEKRLEQIEREKSYGLEGKKK